ncbi:MAG: flagellar M-ring protein FliF [Deltaproteobacteria bacterium]|nr:flagellar M-ring protein FliF [Deltaproteobacteria bacterium]
MANKFQESLAKAGGLWTRSTSTQKILIGGLVLCVLTVFFLLLFWLNSTEYKVLYSNLYSEDAGAVIESLKKDNVPYKIEDGGKTILVPTDKVYEQRLKIAGQGSMHGQGIGFEIFDNNAIGQTDFVQRINYQRALQGELGRTIIEFPDITSARVHLVLPNKSLFIEEQSPPSASVILGLSGRRKLSPEQVQSIVNLLMTGVEGLNPSHITIADTKGEVLYEPRDKDGFQGLTSTQFEYQMGIERNLQQRIEQMLAPLVGPGKVVAKVSAALDFSKRTIVKELYDPDKTVVRSEQKSSEDSLGSANVNNEPTPQYQGEENPLATATTQSLSRSSSTTNFEINREEQQIVAPVGEINKLSVAVLVDGKHAKDNTGQDVFTPLPQEDLVRIQQLVERAVGFDQTRGDSIEVSCISFGSPQDMPEPGIMDTAAHYFQLLGKPLLNSVLVLLFLLLVVRPVVMAIIRPKIEEQRIEEREGLPGAEERMALAEGLEGADLAEIEERKRIEDARSLATQNMDQNMEQAVLIIKNWLREGEA